MFGSIRVVCSIVFLCFQLASCQSNGDSRQATSSESAPPPIDDSFSFRKLAPGTPAQATKLLQSTTALQPDQTNPIAPCAYGDFSMRELAVKSVSMSYNEVDSAMEVLSAMGYTTRVVGGAGNNIIPGERFRC